MARKRSFWLFFMEFQSYRFNNRKNLFFHKSFHQSKIVKKKTMQIS